MHPTSYVLGLGSNRPHHRHGPPRDVVRAGLAALRVEVLVVSRISSTVPLGPGTRRYANMAALVRTELDPPALLARAKATERSFGRRRGRRWGDRVLDVDLLAWGAGRWRSGGLTLPHPRLTERAFALLPMAEVAPHWVVGGRTARQRAYRLTARRPLHKSAPAGRSP